MKNKLEKILTEIPLKLSEAQIKKLCEFADCLKNSHRKSFASWNSDNEGLTIHFKDSFYTLPLINPGYFLDIGSGAGIPGIIYSICWPDSQGILMDSQTKRCEFMTDIIFHLKLEKNLKVLHGRAEILAHDFEWREKFNLVTARALASFPEFIEYSSAFIKKEGYLNAIRSTKDQRDLKNYEYFLKLFSLKLVREKIYRLTPETSFRWVASFQKKNCLSNRFPRKKQTYRNARSTRLREIRHAED